MAPSGTRPKSGPNGRGIAPATLPRPPSQLPLSVQFCPLQGDAVLMLSGVKGPRWHIWRRERHARGRILARTKSGACVGAFLPYCRTLSVAMASEILHFGRGSLLISIRTSPVQILCGRLDPWKQNGGT